MEESKIDKFFNRYGALTMLSVVALICYFLNLGMSSFMGPEGILMFIIGFMSIIGFIGVIQRFKEISKINRLVYTLGIILSVGAFYHMKGLETTLEEFTDKYSIEETNNFFIFEADGYELLWFDKEGVVYDEEHPIKAYESYKTDIFGYDMMRDIKFKSDLMNYYVYPKY